VIEPVARDLYGALMKWHRLQRHGFRVEVATAYDYGYAISARRIEISPLSKAA
jgi:hypothetical protein